MAELVIEVNMPSTNHDYEGGLKVPERMRRARTSEQELLRGEHHPAGNAHHHHTEILQEEEELSLKSRAHHAIRLFSPLTLCMVMVVATMSSINYCTEKRTSLVVTPFREQTDDIGTQVLEVMANAGIILGVIAVFTGLLVLAYKYRCTKLIHGWVFLFRLVPLFLFSYLYLAEVLKAYNLPMDYITCAIVIWNFGMVGMISRYWKALLLLHRAYLILISALWALFFIKYLPDWTTWAFLGFVTLWDLFSVLAPFGPLRVLVETAQERNEQIFPSIIPMYTLVETVDLEQGPAESTEPPQKKQKTIWSRPLHGGSQ